MIHSVLEHTYIPTNGIKLHVVQTGPEDGKRVILLHGFPEFWYSWRHQIDALVNAGFRLIIPDQRGYNLSDRPSDPCLYSLDTLADDIIGLIDYTEQDKALIVGHDWGGGAAWWLANRNPERIEKLTVLNIAHHAVLSKAIKQDPDQRRKSLYMAYFRLPLLPEISLKLGNWWALAQWAFGDNPAFTADDLKKYRAAWSQSGAITGMLNWYRGVQKAPPQRLPSPQIKVPTLLIWGKHDHVMKAELAQKSIDLCDDGRVHYIDHASHWVQHEAADEVSRVMCNWLKD